MKTEFEITFPNIDHNCVRKQIRDLGGTCTQDKTLMKRVIFKHTDKELKNSYFRVRDEGNTITCTYKTILDGKLDITSIKEVETKIEDFEAMCEILTLTGLKKVAMQESYRETWKIGDEVEYMLDEWPGLQPFLEIEGTNKKVVKEYSEKLGFTYSDGIFGAVDELYFLELGIAHNVINTMPEISFENPPKK
ncbi:CYTH domain-containing protein [Candidatus Gracilibacteria bacterium]|nr:CYTH domain-containing protein [Candidatus Gracilibacteria bacterium]